jgi:septal ring factor EnvC (AmiA/AmiB activator)
MNATSNKGARLSRDIQAKIGEKLALLYLPVLRQDIPQQLSELSRRLDATGKTRRTRRSSLSRMLDALRRRGARS